MQVLGWDEGCDLGKEGKENVPEAEKPPRHRGGHVLGRVAACTKVLRHQTWRLEKPQESRSWRHEGASGTCWGRRGRQSAGPGAP